MTCVGAYGPLKGTDLPVSLVLNHKPCLYKKYQIDLQLFRKENGLLTNDDDSDDNDDDKLIIINNRLKRKKKKRRISLYYNGSTH